MLSEKFLPNSQRLVITTENPTDLEIIKVKYKDAKIICTHSGTFHADEVLSTMMLKFYPGYENSIVIRSRNLEIMKKCDIVVDVGGIIDPKTFRFDHHMKEFIEVFNKDDEDFHNIKLSSAGLVYKYLGKEILINILKNINLYESNKTHIDEIYKKIYINLIMSVDAHDNGINQYETKDEPKYKNVGEFSSRIGRLNPNWNEVNVDLNERFKKAWDVAEEELYYCINNFANSYYLAYNYVEKAVEEAIKENKLYIVLEVACPWKKCLYEIEKKLNIEGKFLFGLIKKSETEYVTNTISVSEGSFEFRKGLPEEWRGLRGEKLAEVSGIKDAVFVHASGFIGFWRSKESALKAINYSLEHTDNKDKK